MSKPFTFNPHAAAFTPTFFQQTPTEPIAVQRTDQDEQKSAPCTKSEEPVNQTRRAVSLMDFETESAIGEGLVGQVYLVRRRADGHLFAMKVIPKDLIVEGEMVEHMKAERHLQARMSEQQHPFLARLFYAFQDSESLYLILEYVAGGDLSFHLSSRVKLPEDVVCIIAAELCLALEHLHANNIAHRDIKAANILIDKDGHIRLTDFGMSKQLATSSDEAELEQFQGASTYCGTLAYMAPEILGLIADSPGHEEKAIGYGVSVDWWSYGVLLYEMLTGLKPFAAENRSGMLQAINKGKPQTPSGLSEEAIDLLQGLLQPCPQNRLAGRSVRAHRFFSSVDFDALMAKSVEPPWKPWCDDEDFPNNFPSSLTDFTPPTVSELGGHTRDLAFQVEGFSYTDPFVQLGGAKRDMMFQLEGFSYTDPYMQQNSLSSPSEVCMNMGAECVYSSEQGETPTGMATSATPAVAVPQNISYRGNSTGWSPDTASPDHLPKSQVKTPREDGEMDVFGMSL